MAAGDGSRTPGGGRPEKRIERACGSPRAAGCEHRPAGYRFTADRFDPEEAVNALVYRLLGMAAVCVALTFLSDAFLTVSNVLNVLRQAGLLFLIASGATLVILSAGLDLSIGATV